jgi:hypothetical protein
MTDIIDRSLNRTIRHLESEIETKDAQLRKMLDRLAYEFELPESPSFSPFGSDLSSWRELKFRIEASEEALQILKATVGVPNRDELLRGAFLYIDSRLTQAKGSFKVACQDIAAEFRRKRGPRSISSSESDWLLYRVQVEVLMDLAEKLYDAREALGLLPAEETASAAG